MPEGTESPRCAHQAHLRGERGAAEAQPFCSCPAGLIHMNDCPVTLGLPCVHFRPLEGAPAVAGAKEIDETFGLLMEDYLTRAYYHRVRALSPTPDAWQQRRERLAGEYAALGMDAPDEAMEESEYESEKGRLVENRRRRWEEREERKRQEEDAKRMARGLPPKHAVPREDREEREEGAAPARAAAPEEPARPAAGAPDAGIPPVGAETGAIVAGQDVPGGEEGAPDEGAGDDADEVSPSAPGAPAGPPSGRRRRRRRRRRPGGPPPAP